MLKHLNSRPEETVLVGYSPFDFEAAEAAGLKSLLVATGSHTESELAESTSAAGIYSNLY